MKTKIKTISYLTMTILLITHVSNMNMTQVSKKYSGNMRWQSKYQVFQQFLNFRIISQWP